MPARGLDASWWPCPGKKGRGERERACRAQDFPGVAEPSCVCNNKTKETYSCVDGKRGPAWVFTRSGGCLLLGAVLVLSVEIAPRSSVTRSPEGMVCGTCSVFVELIFLSASMGPGGSSPLCCVPLPLLVGRKSPSPIQPCDPCLGVGLLNAWHYAVERFLHGPIIQMRRPRLRKGTGPGSTADS